MGPSFTRRVGTNSGIVLFRLLSTVASDPMSSPKVFRMRVQRNLLACTTCVPIEASNVLAATQRYSSIPRSIPLGIV